MAIMYAFQLSSQEKVFLDYTLPQQEYSHISALKNERFSYQIAFRSELHHEADNLLRVSIESPLKEVVSVRKVGNVPVEMAVWTAYDEHYERVTPGMYPDVLYPMENNATEINALWHSLWITVDLNGKISAGNYPITIILTCGKEVIRKTLQVEIIDAMLPAQEMKVTQWFHTDCIANYYRVPVFSEFHWEMIEKFMRTAAENGINMILTPIFTPPLDTEVGGERTTVQLLDIEQDGETYWFGFEKLRRWIGIAKRCGIKYLEMAHLFTQWGLAATPKIVATVNGEEKRIFGWDVSSEDPAYKNFLSQMLPQLHNVLVEEGMDKNTFFHISDEPQAAHIERYKKLKTMVSEFLPGYIFMDALSNFEFYREGAVDCPIPASNDIEPFIEHQVPGLWTYTCCGQCKDVSNRFMSMPSYRTRVIGIQFYKFDVVGFLQWGYNFYNSCLSRKQVNPFVVTDCIGVYPAGDAFSVYPGEDGALESLRIVVFYEGLQDVRALKLLEQYIGKEKVVGIIEEMAGMEIRFDKYPHDKNFLLALRERVNQEIKKCVEK